jgi:peptide/nickel transport system substrate-binding protein
VLAYVSDGPSYNVQLAQYIQSAGDSIGLNIKLDPLPTNTFNNIGFDKSIGETVDMLIQNWFNELPDPVQFYRLFTPGADGSLNIFNYGHYTNATVTSDIQQASQTADPTARANLLVAAQQQVMTDLPWIPLVDMANRLYLGPNVTGPPAAFVQMWYPWAAYLGLAT